MPTLTDLNYSYLITHRQYCYTRKVLNYFGLQEISLVSLVLGFLNAEVVSMDRSNYGAVHQAHE